MNLSARLMASPAIFDAFCLCQTGEIGDQDRLMSISMPSKQHMKAIRTVSHEEFG